MNEREEKGEEKGEERREQREDEREELHSLVLISKDIYFTL